MPRRAISPSRTGDEEYIDIHNISFTSSVDNITAPPPVQAKRNVSFDNHVPFRTFGPEVSREELRAVGPILFSLQVIRFINSHS
jgi:hypothetical protein